MENIYLMLLSHWSLHLKGDPTEERNREVPDDLENCIGDIFDSVVLPINETPGRESNETNLEANRSIEPDKIAIDKEAIEDNTSSNRGKIHSLAFKDIFLHGEEELVKVNIVKVRMARKQRIERSQSLYREIYQDIIYTVDESPMRLTVY